MVASFAMEEDNDPLASPVVEGGSESSNSVKQKHTTTPPAIGLSRTQSTLYRSGEENAMAILLKVFLFLQSITFNGLGTTVNIYLVVIKGWTPLKASWIWFTRDIVCLFGTTPVGAFVDRTKNKKTLLFVAVSFVSSIRLVRFFVSFLSLFFLFLLIGHSGGFNDCLRNHSPYYNQFRRTHIQRTIRWDWQDYSDSVW